MFFKEIDTTNRKAMIEFLTNHFRYYTMNSWNQSTSYANNVKLHNLGLCNVLNENEKRTAYDLLSSEEPNDYTDTCHVLFEEFRIKTGYDISFNGRSAGYLVLYDTIPVPDKHSIGWSNERRTTCKDIDQYETFEDWNDSEIKERVTVVQEFDKLCDNLRNIFIETCKKYKVVDTPVQTVVMVKTLQRKSYEERS